MTVPIIDIRKFSQHLSKRQKQWLWFIALWFSGLGTVLLISYVIKLIMGV